MGTRCLSLVTLLALAVGVRAQPAPETTITPSERTELVELLQRSEQELGQAIAGMSDEQWTFKQAPDRFLYFGGRSRVISCTIFLRSDSGREPQTFS